jgi:hypothetical protein
MTSYIGWVLLLIGAILMLIPLASRDIDMTDMRMLVEYKEFYFAGSIYFIFGLFLTGDFNET